MNNNIYECTNINKKGYCIITGAIIDKKNEQDQVVCSLCGYFDTDSTKMRYFKVVKDSKFHGMFNGNNKETIQRINAAYEHGGCQVFEVNHDQYSKIMEDFK